MQSISAESVPVQSPEAMAALKERYTGEQARSCNECTECCDTLVIPEINKPFGQKCPNSCAAGCAIYAERYDSCKGFKCAWAMGYGKPTDRPDKSGAIADYRDGHLGWKLYGMIVRPGKRALRALNRISANAGVDVLVVGGAPTEEQANTFEQKPGTLTSKPHQHDHPGHDYVASAPMITLTAGGK